MDSQPKYRNPRWIDKENRRVFCEILVGDVYRPCNINVGNPDEGLVNRDFDAIMEEFGEEVLDENTVRHQETADEELKKREEMQEVHHNRMKQETLFEMKLQAFESEYIKNSNNKELKKLLRKAKTLIEVQSFATILIQEELNKSE